MMVDYNVQVELKCREMLVEADRARLAAQVLQDRPDVRRELALACHRLADWLDDPRRYVQHAESGRAA